MILDSGDHTPFIRQVKLDSFDTRFLQSIKLLVRANSGDYISVGEKLFLARSEVGND
jgi:hypothetical protein